MINCSKLAIGTQKVNWYFYKIGKLIDWKKAGEQSCYNVNFIRLKNN